MFEPLPGQTVTILANDFVSLDTMARLVSADIDAGIFLLRLKASVSVSGVSYTHAVAKSRLAGSGDAELLRAGSMGYAVTWVPDQKFDPGRPFNLSWWRGGAAAIADIRP